MRIRVVNRERNQAQFDITQKHLKNKNKQKNQQNLSQAQQNIISMVKKNPNDVSKVAFDSYGRAMLINPPKSEKLTGLGYQTLNTQIRSVSVGGKKKTAEL